MNGVERVGLVAVAVLVLMLIIATLAWVVVAVIA